MYEHRKQPLVTREAFFQRLFGHFCIALAIIMMALSIGILGYHYFEGLSWLDALLNASMILSGMGSVNPITKISGKWFASFYALFSGIVFITTAGVLIAPILHRFFHTFHLEVNEK